MYVRTYVEIIQIIPLTSSLEKIYIGIQGKSNLQIATNTHFEYNFGGKTNKILVFKVVLHTYVSVTQDLLQKKESPLTQIVFFYIFL